MTDYALGQGTGPLKGIKVVEIAGIGPGPHAATLLADLGADVIRVEKPGGAASAGPREADLLTRGRPSVAMDLKNPDALEALLELIAAADVLIEGMRPGVTERLGIGPDDVPGPQPAAGLRPDDGLGPGRPAGAGRRPRHELHRDRRRAPRPRPGPRPSALPEQPRRRLRRRVDVPRDRGPRGAARGADQRPGPGRRRRDRRRRRAPQPDVGLDARRRLRRRSSGRANLLDGGIPYYDLYETSDGKHMSVGALEPQFYDELVRRLGIADRAPDRHDSRQLGELRELLDRDVQAEDPGRVGRGLRRQRRLLRAGPADRPRRPSTRTCRRAGCTSSTTACCSRPRPRGSPGPRRP